MVSETASARDEEKLRQSGGRRHPRPRIETLADLIFGLSLSIGSIALLATSPTSATEINNHIVAFMFTFLILITAWLIYTSFMSVLPVETRSVTLLNVVLLLLVAIVPYLLNNAEVVSPSLDATQASAIRDYSSTLFTLDLFGILLILAIFAHVLSLEEKDLVAPEALGLFRSGRNRMSVLAFLMVISIAPQFWQFSILGVPARLYMWYLPLISYWLGRILRPESRTYRLE
jgi:uncharacterized membrane protein